MYSEGDGREFSEAVVDEVDRDDTEQSRLFCPLVAHGCDFCCLSSEEASRDLMAKLITILIGDDEDGMGRKKQLHKKRRRRNVIITQQHGLWGSAEHGEWRPHKNVLKVNEGEEAWKKEKDGAK